MPRDTQAVRGESIPVLSRYVFIPDEHHLPVVDLRTNGLFALSPFGKIIIGLVDGIRDVTAIANLIAERFPEEPKTQLHKNVATFLYGASQVTIVEWRRTV